MEPVLITPDDIRRIRRKLSHMTQDDFALVLGVHTLTVSKWERGILSPRGLQGGLLMIFKKVTLEDGFSDWSISSTLHSDGPIRVLHIILSLYYSKKESEEKNG